MDADTDEKKIDGAPGNGSAPIAESQTPNPISPAPESAAPVTVKAPLPAGAAIRPNAESGNFGEHGKFQKGHTVRKNRQPPGIARAVPNRNMKLLCEARRFRGPNGKSLERVILEVAVAEAIKGHPSLLTEMISRIYITLTPESTGIRLPPGAQNTDPNQRSESPNVRLSEHLEDAGTRQIINQLVGQLASRIAVPGGNGNPHK